MTTTRTTVPLWHRVRLQGDAWLDSCMCLVFGMAVVAGCGEIWALLSFSLPY